MINLFEYQNKENLPDSLENLDVFLDDIWQKRDRIDYYGSEEGMGAETQRFLQFFHKSQEVKSNKYVGIINYQGQRINLLPKIFYEPNKEYLPWDIQAIQLHILWWLSYCRKIKFPSYQTNLGTKQSDFFEVLIYLFAKYTRELLSSAIYQQYEEVSNELNFIKGRINIRPYISENLSKGRWHKLNCAYDAFVMDNRFNRIVKFVANLLFNSTNNFENKRNLREILFILDEVSYVSVTAEECANVRFNPMFSDFETVRDYCHLFLSNYISFDYKNDLKLFAFLLPMEYVFEDFIFGFIDKELDEVKAKSQITSTHLDEERNFALRPDLYLKLPGKNIIADTKYKIVYSDDKDPKKGISQSDLYQMLGYAVRFKIDEIFLFYPNTITEHQSNFSELHIRDEFAVDTNVRIASFQLPIINYKPFDDETGFDRSITELFESTKDGLSNRLLEIFRIT